MWLSDILSDYQSRHQASPPDSEEATGSCRVPVNVPVCNLSYVRSTIIGPADWPWSLKTVSSSGTGSTPSRRVFGIFPRHRGSPRLLPSPESAYKNYEPLCAAASSSCYDYKHHATTRASVSTPAFVGLRGDHWQLSDAFQCGCLPSITSSDHKCWSSGWLFVWFEDGLKPGYLRDIEEPLKLLSSSESIF